MLEPFILQLAHTASSVGFSILLPVWDHRAIYVLGLLDPSDIA